LDGDFEQLYPPQLGRPSIPPERLLRAMLLQHSFGASADGADRSACQAVPVKAVSGGAVRHCGHHGFDIADD